jgi:exodeoxyribonuclease V alpha subunit
LPSSSCGSRRRGYNRHISSEPVHGTAFSDDVVVVHQRWASDDGGFAVLDAETAEEPIVLIGPLAHLDAGERAHVTGAWVRDPRYGPQVKVTSAVPLPPVDDEAVVKYLVKIRHIGPRRARQLVELHGTATFDAIDRDPHTAFAGAGLRGTRASEAAASWSKLRATRHLHVLLAPAGLTNLTGRLYSEYGDAAARVVREEPYELTSVFGVGFETADRLARGLGLAIDDPARTRAAALHSLAQAERDGSTCLPRERVLAEVTRLTGVEAGAALVDELAAAGDVTLLDDEWVYRPATARLEAELADRVAELLASPTSPKLSVPGDGEVPGDVELAPEQLSGVLAAFEHRLSIVTGGPGTGKTASIRAIAAVASEQHAKIVLVAPTGRAAVRMTEATDVQASTVHSALGWIPGQGPSLDEDDPLDCDLLILDEASMANLELLVTLLRAVAPKTHVVLVGDADQLAPVGAGKPFAELVEIDAVPTARLEHIFRQAAGSMIVQGAHAIRAGNPPSFAHTEGMRRDLFLIEERDANAARRTIVDLVTDRLPKHYGVDPIDDIQVFAPVYRGDVGITALNAALRERLNPDGNKAPGGLRIGDKLMLTGRNLHDLGLMNGTVLRLLEAPAAGDGEDDEDDGMLTVSADGVVFHLSAEEAERLALAYACSVHKGQGIELPIAVIVAHPAAGARFLRREMLYTALTRATLATIVVGRADAVAASARTPDTVRRNSGLGRRISRTAPRSPLRTSRRSAAA